MYIILSLSMGLFVNELVNCMIEECNAFYFGLSIIMLLGAMLAVGKAEYEKKLLNNQGS